MNRFSLKLLFVCLIFVLSSCSSSTISNVDSHPDENMVVIQEEPVVQTLSFEQKVDKIMEENMFSGSILLVEDNKVKIAKGYNMANSETMQLNGSDTVFQIGSLTKAFTAAAIMQLQEMGKLNINDSVQKYIEDYPYENVTLYQLLTHTAGIPNLTAFPDFISTMDIPVSVSENIAKFLNKPLEFEPGSQFAYCNSGYILLGAVIENVSGQSYSQFIEDHIMSPLGMGRSGYLKKDRITDDIASGYWEATERYPAMDIDMTVPYAAGGIYSTTNDLYKWIQGLEEGKVINAGSWRAMRTSEKNGYGLGWGINDAEGLIYAHGGAINGFSSFIYRDISKGTAVIILSNVEGVQTSELLDLLLNVLESE
ncbi:serine hydrolase domain-containing protein [Paenibacillus nitricinens]|uniref:serine hydrolase domain-containing protein n=1 Tax=Paenibacillus nitricinens TaxID=3367691 RepID=UPI003F8383D6